MIGKRSLITFILLISSLQLSLHAMHYQKGWPRTPLMSYRQPPTLNVLKTHTHNNKTEVFLAAFWSSCVVVGLGGCSFLLGEKIPRPLSQEPKEKTQNNYGNEYWWVCK